MSFDHLLTLAASSGGILFLMPLLLLITLTVSLERVWFLGRLKERGASLIKRVESLNHLDLDALTGPFTQ